MLSGPLANASAASVTECVKSCSNGLLRTAAEDFARNFPEVLFIQPNSFHPPADFTGNTTGNRKRDHSMGIYRLSLMQLAVELARPAMAEKGFVPLGALAQEALAARVVFLARRDNNLTYFQPVAALPGFPRALAKTIRDLRLGGVLPGQLSEAGPAGSDLANLLGRYELELSTGSFIDAAGILRLASDAAAENAHRWAGLPVVFLDTELATQGQRDFFSQVTRQSPAVLAAINKEDRVVELLLGVVGRDLDEPNPSTALEHLRRNLFQSSAAPFQPSASNKEAPADDPHFEYFSAPGEGLEAVEIARRVLRFARQGVRLDHMAILLRNPERYQPMVEDALRRASIPAYFSRGTARPDPSGRAFLALLSCASENLSASRFAEYLSLGQLPAQSSVPWKDPVTEWVGPDDELLAVKSSSGETAQDNTPESEKPALPAPRGWEKLLVDAAVIGGRDRWERRLNGLEAEWELQLAQSDSDGASASLLSTEASYQRERLEHLRNLRSFALPLIDALGALPQIASWADWLEQLSSLARICLRQADGVLALLADLIPMGEVGPVTLDEVSEVLTDRLRFLRREPPKRRWGQVFVGSVEEARGVDFRVVFLPGLAEGLFPQRPLEDPLLLDEFRQVVNDLANQPVLSLRSDHVHAERLRLHIATGAARDHLIASYPRMEVAEARPRVPSFYALELPRAIHGSIPELTQFERHAREAAPARLNWPAPRHVADAIDDAEYDLTTIAAGRDATGGFIGSARHLMLANAHLARSLRGRHLRWEKQRWQTSDGLITADAAALAALAGHGLTVRAWSPSSLEKFSTCPYKFALHSIYRLRPREAAIPLEQLDPLTRGSLFHAVQFQLFQQLQTNDMLPVTPGNLASAATLSDRVLQQVGAEYAEKLAPAIQRVWDSEIEDLRGDLRGWLHYVAVNEADWIPRFFEQDFGYKTETNLAEGVRLHGRIDLVEQHSTRETWRVTDHKTGKRPEMVPRWVGGGKNLQPLLYALAIEETLEPPGVVEAGRLLFATQRGQYTPMEIKLDDRAREFLAKLLANIDSAITGGFLPPVPDKDACVYCDYRIVCGPYEERRLLKKDRRDDRLDLLYQIRGMA